MEEFTTQVGQPSTTLESFTIHGYSDNFLAARVRFLAAYERVYLNDHPLSERQRRIRVPKPIFATFDNLQRSYHQEQGWINKNPDAEGGEELQHSSFAIVHWANQMITKPNPAVKSATGMRGASKDTWTKLWSMRRKYNWWVPLASSNADIRFAHDMMVSHGVTLFSAILAYGTAPIEFNDATRHIEHSTNLCIAHIEKFWQLDQLAIAEKEWSEGKKNDERQEQMENVQYNMAICEQVKLDLEKARMIAPERIMRSRVSEGISGG